MSPMKLALISDIHGNLSSLQAVVRQLEKEFMDAVVCLGDVAATGPQPREVVELLMRFDCPTVMGNADAQMFDPPVATEDEDEEARRFAEIDRWCAGRLSSEHLEYLRGFRESIRWDLAGVGDLLCFHGSPGSFDEVIEATTPEEELGRLLHGAEASVMAGGHTHIQMLRRFGETTLLNPGSIGLPYSGTGESIRNPPWAEYAVISAEKDALTVELRRVSVDAEEVRRSALESGMPHAKWWASGWGGRDDSLQ